MTTADVIRDVARHVKYAKNWQALAEQHPGITPLCLRYARERLDAALLQMARLVTVLPKVPPELVTQVRGERGMA